MICYKDKAWCATSVAEGCHNLDCDRNYTRHEKNYNEMHVGLPISVSEFKTKDCGYEPV